MNLYQRFRSRFPSDLDRTFAEMPDGRTWSYAALDEESARMATVLLRAGVRPGDRVVVQVEKSAQAIALYLAVLRVGAVFLPLNTAYTLAELEYFLTDAEPSLVVCAPERSGPISELARKASGATVLTLAADGTGTLSERARSAEPAAECVARAEDDLAAILYTSGTTGRSKGAMLTIGNLWSNAVTLEHAWGFEASDVLLHALPIFHAHGLFVALHCTLASGCRMILLPKFETEAVMRALPRATVMMGVPTFYTRLLEVPEFDRDLCRGIRLFVSGSAPLLAESWLRFKERTGHEILERYGMTETAMNTSNPLEGRRVPGSVGPALPGIEVRVVDETGRPLPTDAVGMLEVRGPNVFKGYWKMPEKTAEEFRPDGFFVTGDLARIDSDGYVYIVGRAKDLIITGGYNVYPKEVEDAINAIEGVAESAVVGIPDADFGERVIAVVRPETPDTVLDEAEIIRDLKARLAGYKVPKRIVFRSELPRNVMGKVQKNVLRSWLTEGAG